MARVSLFQGGEIQNQGVTDARFRAADFGPSPVAEGLKAIGEAGTKAADKIDEIQDINARVEANRLAVEHSEAARQIGKSVKETLGEGAEDAANGGIEQLNKATSDILGRASPRARLLLENEIRGRNVATTDSWLEHGFRQKADALETTSVARINRVVDDAADVEDEHQAVQMLGEISSINERRAQFFGKGKEWLMAEDQKAVSTFYKSRALKLAQGASGSASAAIAYAEQHRDMLTDDDYMHVVQSYNDSAVDEAATAIVYGGNPIGAAVDKPKDPEDGGPPARLDGTAFFKSFVVPHEGREYVVDSNGAGVKYGINAAFNPGVDVKNLTEEGAARVFNNRYYVRSGADKLPPGLAAIHADTFFLNEREAGRILRQSGGDVDRYIELRKAFLGSLVRGNPAKYGKYEAGWDRRTKELADYADRLGGDGSPSPANMVGPNTDLETIRNNVMARTDIGLNLKRKVIQQIEQRRSEVRQERQIHEESMDRALLGAALDLGDRFTDVKQLPQNIWMAAPPNVRDRYVAMAKTNKTANENKPMTPEIAAQVGFIRAFKPQSLADPKVLHDLAKKGVPTGTLRQLAQEGGQAQGALAAAKPEAIARGSLEAIARPAFEAAGIRLWSTEAGEKDKKGRVAEQRMDAYQQLQLLSFLDNKARSWALANPGKHPDDAVMQQWVGQALIRNQATGQAVGTMDDSTVVANIGEANRQRISNLLRQNGLEPSRANIARYWRLQFQSGQ
jgi:hypothetical protein